MRARGVLVFVALACPASARADDGPPVSVDAVLEQAIRMAELVEPNDARVTSLAEIAKVQMRSGRVEAARETFERASRIVDTFHGGWGYYRLGIARAQAVAGLREEARANRRRGIEEVKTRSVGPEIGSRLADAAGRSANEGDAEGARELAGALGEATAEERVVAFASLAGAAAKSGRLDEARDALAQAEAAVPEAREDARKRPATASFWLSLMGIAQARLARAEAEAGHPEEARGRIARALDAAEAAPNPAYAPLILAHIAPAHRALDGAAAGQADVDRAVQLAGALPTPAATDTVLARAALILIEGGDPEAGRALLTRAREVIGPADAPVAARLATVEALISLGDWKPALDMVRDPAFGPRTTVLQKLARAQVRAGGARTALDWAEAESEPAPRVHALVGIAEGILERQADKPEP